MQEIILNGAIVSVKDNIGSSQSVCQEDEGAASPSVLAHQMPVDTSRRAGTGQG